MQGFWENVQQFILCLHFFFFFFFKVEISSRTLIPLLRPGWVHSGSVSWDDCDWVFPDELRVSSFPDRFPHYDCGIVNPLWLRWVKGVCMFRCNLPPAIFFTCHCGNTGVERTTNRVSTKSWLWKRKVFCRSCQDLNSQPFDHESSALTNKLSRLHCYYWWNEQTTKWMELPFYKDPLACVTILICHSWEFLMHKVPCMTVTFYLCIMPDSSWNIYDLVHKGHVTQLTVWHSGNPFVTYLRGMVIIIIIYPLTARVVWAPLMILQPVFSIFPCSPLPSGTCRTPGLSSPWCCLPPSFSVCILFSPLFTVPCKMALATPDERETWPYHCSLRLFTIVRRSSCEQIAC